MDSIELARKIRVLSLKMVYKAHASHIGGALSMADILAVLYNDVLKYNPNYPDIGVYCQRDMHVYLFIQFYH